MILSPFPGPACLYLLVGGIVLGVLVGPAVMGRLAPSLYQELFVGGAQLSQQLLDQQNQTANQLELLEQTDVTDVALAEQLALGQSQQAVIEAQLQQAQQQRLMYWSGLASAIVLAVIAMMMIEALVAPDIHKDKAAAVPPALSRLVSARYALVGLWIAVVLAQPRLLSQLPVLFAAGLILLAAASALVPMGKPTQDDA